MFTVNADKIRTLMFEHEISGINELARQAQLNATTTAKVLKDGTTATAKTISRLAKFFAVDINELIQKKG